MNIFAVHKDPVIAAKHLCNAHVVKMILESADMLSLAHRLCDGTRKTVLRNGRNVVVYELSDCREELLINNFRHVNHPCSLWTRKTYGNYMWLYEHYIGLLDEFEFRYGHAHKYANSELSDILKCVPLNIPMGKRTRFVQAFNDHPELMDADPIIGYRNYYANAKQHLHLWKVRQPPAWLEAHKLTK